MATLLAGCGRPDEQGAIDSARAELAAGNASTAAVQLRILLAQAQQTGETGGELRVLFGRALLESGDAAGAELELQRARGLGQPESVVAPHLARAWLAQQKYAQLVAAYGKTMFDGGAQTAELKTLLATAYRNQGRLTEAEEAVADALAALPEHVPALLMKASLRSARGDHQQAAALLDGVLRDAPQNVQAWTIKGQMLAAAGDAPRAAEAFERSLKLKGDSVSAHTALVALELSRGDVTAAVGRWEAMRAVLPNHPQTRLHEAKIALARGDARRARELTLPLLGGGDQNLALLQVAGAAELLLKSPARAENLLSKAVALAPASPVPRLMLAQALVASGQSTRALQTLAPLLSGESPPEQALLLAAQASLLEGQAGAADASFARAARLYPKSPAVATAQAVARAQANPKSEQALDELGALVAREPDRNAALTLVSARLARGQTAAALAALGDMSRKLPDDPLPHVLSGRVALQQRDLPAAQRHFERALALDKSHYPAVAGLAGIELGLGNVGAATQRFEAILSAEPDHLLALMALAEIRARQADGHADAVRLLERASKAHPDSRGPRELLVAQLLSQQRFQAAVAAAQAGLASRPDEPALLELLGRAQVAAGDTQQAVSTFTRLAAVLPKSFEPHLRIAELHLSQQRIPAANDAVNRARTIAPRALPVLRMAAGIAAREGDTDRALGVAREAQAAHVQEAAGFLIEGEIHAMRGDAVAAERLLRVALGKRGAEEAVRRLHGLLLTSGRAADAARLAGDWQSRRPADLGFVHYLAGRAVERKEYASAEALYRQVVRQQPRNAEALNNIAWLMLQQRKAGALAYAERATQAFPNNAALMDTLAMAHASAGQFERAVSVQQQVLKLVPGSGTFGLNMARIYVMAGDKSSARRTLEPLVAMKFAGQEEARKLLASIGGGG